MPTLIEDEMVRDAVKSALPGFRHLVDWWGLPTRLEWALAPAQGAWGFQAASLAVHMAFQRLRRPWVQELKPSSFSRRLRPAAKVQASSWGDSLGAF